jgi:hypothetical protein
VALKVSVIVPVYNPGRHIDDCIASVLRQTLPKDEYEAIFVDDGSTDGTGERLDALAAEHENLCVIHIPNSGWPGRPRNVGTDAARGEYVYYMDNDDWLADDALELLYERAQSTGADIVIGKVVGHRRRVPKELFRRNRDGAVLGKAPLLSLLTPHKLFRRAFLAEHGLRFPEGRVRLEDHLFVVPAYFRARRIAVLADHAVYHWVRREDDTNASVSRFEPEGYFRNVRQVLDVVERETVPGDLRDRLLSHWYAGKSLGRLGGGTLLGYPPDYRRALFEEIRRLADERFGRSVEAHLPAVMRPRAVLLRAGALDDLETLAATEKGVRADAVLESVQAEEDGVRVRASALLTYADGAPVRFDSRLDRLYWRLPVSLATPVPEEALDMTGALAAGRADLIAVHRRTKAEFFVEGSSRVELVPLDGGCVGLRLHCDGSVTPATGAAGAALARGLWDLSIRIAACGWMPQVRLGSDGIALPGTITGSDGRRATAYATANRNLSVAVDRDPPAPPSPPAELEPWDDDPIPEEPVEAPRSRTVLTRLAGLARRA